MTATNDTTDAGTVYLVGAGPGDPELLTVRASRLLGDADVVLHDSLVDDAVLDRYPDEDATVVHVGKRPDGDGRRWSQAEINERLVEAARDGGTVVRLKGGAPTVFGRGGEEAEFLADHGVPFEVVPGVTSPVAAPEVVGVPVTHREHASSVTVVTGHEDPTKEESALDWAALADTVSAGGTLVVLMGVSRLPENVAALCGHGVPADTPVAVIERATWDDESLVTARLDDVVERTREADVDPPAVVVVGDVVSVREDVAALLDERYRGTGSDAPRPGDGHEAGASGPAPTTVRSLDPTGLLDP